MKQRGISFFLLSFLVVALCAGIVSAAKSETATDIAITPIKNYISTNEVASFRVSVTNDAERTQTYRIYALELGWIIEPKPEDRIFDLKEGETRSTIVTVRAVEPFKPGAYAPTLYIDTFTGNLAEEYVHFPQSLKIYVSPEGPVDYLPSVHVSVDMNDKVDPQQPLAIKIVLDNRNPLDLKGSTIRVVETNLPEFAREIPFDLPPLEKKTIEYTVTPDPFQEPGEYTLLFVLERQGGPFKVVEKKIEIVSITPPFRTSLEQKTVFFDVFNALTMENSGNLRNTQSVRHPVSAWEALFVSGENKVISEAGQRYLAWEIILSPGESSVHYFVFKYRTLFYIILVLVLLLVFYWYARSPITVLKKASTVKIDEHGGVSEMKVILEIRNKLSTPLKQLTVEDLVPAIANVEKNLVLGTLAPKEVLHLKHGTKVIWSLQELDGMEHRLITYKVHAKLNILGTVSLPRASVQYRGRFGQLRKAFSNVFHLKP